MQCNKCGAHNDAGTNYCKICGSPLPIEVEQPSYTGMESGNGNTGNVSSGNGNGYNQYNNSYNNQNGYSYNNNYAPQDNRNGGNGIASMVLGIVSIVFGCSPLIGLICGIIAVVMSRKDAQAGIRTGFHKAGLVCGIIGICLGGLSLVYWMIYCGAYSCVICSLSTPHAYKYY